MKFLSLAIIISFASSCASFYKINNQVENNISTIISGRKISSIDGVSNEFQKKAEIYYLNRGVPEGVAVHKHYRNLSFHPNLNLEKVPAIIKNAIYRIQKNEQLVMFKSIIKFSDEFKAPYLYQYLQKLVEIGLVDNEEAVSFIRVNSSAKKLIAEFTETIDGHSKHDLTNKEVSEIIEVSEWLETESQLVSFKSLMKKTTDSKIIKMSYEFSNIYQVELLNYYNNESVQNLERHFDYIKFVDNEYKKNALIAFVKRFQKDHEAKSLFKDIGRREFESMTDKFWDVFKKIETRNQMDLIISSINDHKEDKIYFSKEIMENFKNANLMDVSEFEEATKLNNLAKNFLVSRVASPQERLKTGVPIRSMDMYRYRLNYEDLITMTEQVDIQEKFDKFVSSVQKLNIHAVNDSELLNSFGIVKNIPVKIDVTPKESKLDNCLSALSTLLEQMFKNPSFYAK